MPLPKPRKGEKLADFMGKFMGNSTAVKDYPDNKQRYAVGASVFRTTKKKQKSNLEEGSFILTPNEDESFAQFLGRFVASEEMVKMFPDASIRAEVASEIYDDAEETDMGNINTTSESGSDSTDIEPAIGESTSEDKEDEEDESLAYASGGGGAPAGIIPTAVIQGQGKRKLEAQGDEMTIRGVSVLTTGLAKGHNLQIDSQTLEQVKKCAESYKSGVKVNENHGAGIGDIVGKLTNFRIDETGQKLLADLTFLQSRFDRAKYYTDLAKEIPDSFGISISFSGDSESTGTGIDLARCNELYSADLVQHPASNPTGLFSADCGCVTVDNGGNTNMENKPAEKTYNMEDFEKRMSDLETRLTSLEASMKPSESEPKKEEMQESIAPADSKDKPEDKSEMSAGETAKVELSGVLKEIRTELSKMVSAPLALSAPAVDDRKPQTFAELVNFEMKQGNISKGEALRLCIGKYTEQYRKELSAGGFKSF
jgi:hypothetical protein